MGGGRGGGEEQQGRAGKSVFFNSPLRLVQEISALFCFFSLSLIPKDCTVFTLFLNFFKKLHMNEKTDHFPLLVSTDLLSQKYITLEGACQLFKQRKKLASPTVHVATRLSNQAAKCHVCPVSISREMTINFLFFSARGFPSSVYGVPHTSLLSTEHSTQVFCLRSTPRKSSVN